MLGALCTAIYSRTFVAFDFREQGPDVVRLPLHSWLEKPIWAS